MKRIIFFIIFWWVSFPSWAQESQILSFEEYLAYVKRYHPLVKKADLLLSESEALLLKSRGAFDPNLAIDYAKKEFKQTDYFDKLNATFNIPTWYGIGFNGNLEQFSGDFLNRESTLPDGGLYSAGVSISLAKDLLINQRIATLKQAKLYKEQAFADNQWLVNNILYEASLSYFNWIKTYQQREVFSTYLVNADERLQNIISSFQAGDRPAIDTTEARIIVNTRKLQLEKSRLDYIKATLDLSNYLWIDNIPLELSSITRPDVNTLNFVDLVLHIQSDTTDIDLLSHPQIVSTQLKLRSLTVEKQLNKNNLLPVIDLKYNFLTKQPETFSNFTTNNYKAGLALNLPIFLRKERADLKLTKYKIRATDFELNSIKLRIKNTISRIQQEVIYNQRQIDVASGIVRDYTTLLRAEERKFSLGESAVFLINSRESNLIKSKLKVIQLENELLNAKGRYFRALGTALSR